MLLFEQLLDYYNRGNILSLQQTCFCLQLEEVRYVTDQFFDLPNAVKSRYYYGKEDHGWVAVEQERRVDAKS